MDTFKINRIIKMDAIRIFHVLDKVEVIQRGAPVKTFITKVVTSEYLDADGITVTTRHIYYTHATGGNPYTGKISALIVPEEKFDTNKNLNS